MMAATGAHGAYHMPSHPMLHAGLPHLSSASSPVFVVHMPKPPLAAPYDPLILGGIPQGMIPVHPLQQLIDNLQQQAQVANEHQNTIHLKLKQAKEALSSQLSDHSYDEIENRKDTDTRTRSGRKDDYGKNTHNNVKPDNGNNDAQLVSYNYDDAPSSTSFPLPSRDITPYGHRLDAGEHNNY